MQEADQTPQLTGIKYASHMVPVTKVLEDVIISDAGVREACSRLAAALDYIKHIERLFADVQKTLDIAQESLLSSEIQSITTKFKCDKDTWNPDWNIPTAEQMFKTTIDALADAKVRTLLSLDIGVVARLETTLYGEKRRVIANMMN